MLTAYTRFHIALAIIALTVMSVLLILAIRNMLDPGGSLDDLPADEIKRRVKE